jgi:type I restriction enzyme S subunit
VLRRLVFSYYKSSNDWEQRKLGDLVEIGDIDHRMPETVEAGIPYLMTGDFCGINELNFDNVKMISEEDYEQLSKKIKPEIGDIIFARYASVGAVRYVDFTRKFLISYSCAIIKKGTKICSRYLYHFLNSDIAQKQIQLEINIGSQANIGIDSMKNNIFVTMPRWHEQENIATYLTNLDHLITLHQRKCDETKKLKKFMLQNMFPQDGENVPRIRFEGFTDAWEQRKLGEICERITRKNKDGESDLPLTIASQYGLIDQRNFFNKVVAAKDMSNYYLLKNGEFAYNKSYSNGYDYGSIKRLNDYEQGCLSTLYICFGITSDEVESDYLECYFDTLKWYSDIIHICAEGARNHGLLNVDIRGFFEEVSVDIPTSKEEQRRISKYLNALDRLITLHQRKYDELQYIKKFMLQNMFP